MMRGQNIYGDINQIIHIYMPLFFRLRKTVCESKSVRGH